MPDEPYRPEPPPGDPDAALARLASEGRQRIREAASAEQATSPAVDVRDQILRSALALHDGSPTQNKIAALTFFAALGSFAGAIVTCAGGDAIDMGPWRRSPPGGVALGLLGGVLVVCAIAITSRTPKASAARVAAERAWVKSLSFPLEGYFELASSPGTPDSRACRLELEVILQPGRPVEIPLVQGAIGVVDPEAAVRGEENRIRIRGAVMPRTSSGETLEGNNRQIVGYVHAVVDRVLVELHRAHPIERVTMKGDSDLSATDRAAINRPGVLDRRW